MRLYTNNIFSYGGSTNNRFTLSKEKDWQAEVNFDYGSATVQGASELGAMSALSLSLRKKFWGGNGELTLIASDIYKGQVQDIATSYASQYSHSSIYGESKTIRMQFRYRFGNQKLEGGRSRGQTDEQRRL
jgi:hypothetical protein